jgi:hypothetical protein
LAFERLRDLVSEAIQICSLLYHDARKASPEENLANLASNVIGPLDQAICEAQEFWYDTPISRYLDRPDGPVQLSRLGKGAVLGSCYHDLALAVADRVLHGAQRLENARDFVRNLRFYTAAGEEVALHLASLIPQVRCECQHGVTRWLAETHTQFPQNPDLGKVHANPQATAGSNPISQTQLETAGDTVDKELALSERQSNLLEALYLMKAFHPDVRQTILAIAQKAEGREVNPEAFKEPMVALKRLGLVETRQGRGGGCWLSPSGRQYIQQIRNLA